MQTAAYWLLVFLISIIVTAALSGPVFYQRVLTETGNLRAFRHQFEYLWFFRIAFYFQFLLLYIGATMAVYWLYDQVESFGGKWWIMSLTFLLADRISSAFWIWFFKKQLPDTWMILGVLALFVFMAISMASRN